MVRSCQSSPIVVNVGRFQSWPFFCFEFNREILEQFRLGSRIEVRAWHIEEHADSQLGKYLHSIGERLKDSFPLSDGKARNQDTFLGVEKSSLTSTEVSRLSAQGISGPLQTSSTRPSAFSLEDRSSARARRTYTR